MKLFEGYKYKINTICVSLMVNEFRHHIFESPFISFPVKYAYNSSVPLLLDCWYVSYRFVDFHVSKLALSLQYELYFP